MIEQAEGHLRYDPALPGPWQYRGNIWLPGGRHCVIEAAVAEDDAGKFFKLQLGLEPGMTSEELQAALMQMERTRAIRAQREFDQTGGTLF